jgi:hypothetical protein
VHRRQELVRDTPNSDELDLTYSLHSLAQRLADIGEYEEALKHARAVLEYRKAFVGVYAKRVGLDLLYAYQLVSTLLLDNGRLSEAIDAAQQGVGCAQKLVEDHPGDFEFGLAFSLIALGWRQLENGEPGKSLALANHAKSILEPLATADPARFETELANCQNARGRFLRDNGDLRAGIEETLEAIAIRRRLAASSPVRFGAELAASLRQLSWFYSSAGEFTGGYAAADEAVSRVRLLSNLFPLRFELELASSLIELSWRSAQCGQDKKSLSAADEAEQLYSKYAESEALRVQPLLASALRARAIRLLNMDNPTAALPLIERACAIHEALPSFIRDRRTNERLDCMLTLARIKIDVGRIDESLKLLDSVLVARRNAPVSPRHEADLAATFLELANLRKRADYHDAALQAATEAEKLFRKLAAKESERFEPDLYRSLKLVSDLQSDAGYSSRAIASLEKCHKLGTQLSKKDPDRFLQEKANDFLALSRRLRSVSRGEQAMQAAAASVASFSNLVKLNPDRFTEDLGWALNQLAVCQGDRDLWQDALTTCAASLCQMRTSARKAPSGTTVPVTGALRAASWLHARDGNRKGALLLAERAARLCLHAVSRWNSTRNNVELARAQSELSQRRRANGDLKGAFAAMCDAVDSWRNLVRHTSVHKADLAGALEGLSGLQSTMDRDAAIRSRREAISFYAQLKELAPVAVEPRIADNLNELSNLLSDSNEAATANLEAIAIFQRYAADNHLSALRLPSGFERRAEILKAKGIISGYVRALRNAVSAREKLMDDQVDGAVVPLVRTLEELALAYRQTGRRRDASVTIDRAKHLSDMHSDELSDAQIARIHAFNQENVSAGEAIKRRVSTLWLSNWRSFRA